MGADFWEHIFVSQCKMHLNNGLIWGNGTEQGPQCSTCPLWPEGHVASSLFLNVSLSYWNRDSHWDKVQCLRSCSRTNNNSLPAVCWIILSPWLVKYHDLRRYCQNLYYSGSGLPPSAQERLRLLTDEYMGIFLLQLSGTWTMKASTTSWICWRTYPQPSCSS